VSRDLVYSQCRAAELPGLIAQLDLEFVAGRGRTVSLATRFPALLGASNLANIFVARLADRVVAATAVKKFLWIAGGREHFAAMIGMVWTDPACRGRGIASSLLASVADALRADTDFAVLWTAQPGFYARAGWAAEDCGSLGEMPGAGAGGPHGAAPDFERVRGIWQGLNQRVARDAAWRPPLPLAVTSLELYEATGAYALAGRQDGSLYCFEMLGDISGLGPILQQMRESCGKLCFNERTASPVYDWLSGQGVKWQEKPLAMWLPLKMRLVPRTALGKAWYVPWLDRI
jgi:predicted N-acetyltransferase YhbS